MRASSMASVCFFRWRRLPSQHKQDTAIGLLGQRSPSGELRHPSFLFSSVCLSFYSHGPWSSGISGPWTSQTLRGGVALGLRTRDSVMGVFCCSHGHNRLGNSIFVLNALLGMTMKHCVRTWQCGTPWGLGTRNSAGSATPGCSGIHCVFSANTCNKVGLKGCVFDTVSLQDICRPLLLFRQHNSRHRRAQCLALLARYFSSAFY